MARRLVILGSTGSIGEQTLDVVSANPDHLSVLALAANSRVEKLREQIKKYKPKIVCVGTDEAKKKLGDVGLPVRVGLDGLIELAALPEADLVVNSLVGGIGLRPTLSALDAGHDVALANKETLVVGGDLVMERVREKKGKLRLTPIDSEHAAIAECLKGRRPDEIRRIILTASGGPFRERPASSFKTITKAEALNHPNWAMGPKITIDSATLMNKGLEVIEAHHLFGVPADRIGVVVHPRSIVHSMVELMDGSLIAQFGAPDMRVPIQQAVLPEGVVGGHTTPFDLLSAPAITFEPVDYEKFPCLRLAFEALASGGTMPAVMNAANEIAVAAFLDETIEFVEIPACVESVMKEHTLVKTPSLEELITADEWARAIARDHLELEKK